jgi:hypothetical protein
LLAGGGQISFPWLELNGCWKILIKAIFLDRENRGTPLISVWSRVVGLLLSLNMHTWKGIAILSGDDRAANSSLIIFPQIYQ